MLFTDKTSPILALIRSSRQTEDESKRWIGVREVEGAREGAGRKRGGRRERALQTDFDSGHEVVSPRPAGNEVVSPRPAGNEVVSIIRTKLCRGPKLCR